MNGVLVARRAICLTSKINKYINSLLIIVIFISPLYTKCLRSSQNKKWHRIVGIIFSFRSILNFRHHFRHLLSLVDFVSSLSRRRHLVSVFVRREKGLI